jgi:integrase
MGLKARLDGMPLPSEQLTVGRYLQEWVQTTKTRVRLTTWQRYEQLLRRYAIPSLGGLPLTRLEPRHLQQLYIHCLSNGLAPRTTRQLHTVLGGALRQAVKWGLVARNVAALVDPPRVPRHEIRPLSTEQARTLLRAARGQRLEALYVLALTTGMRLGELLALRWQDLDLDDERLQVQHTLSRTPQRLQLTEPKSACARRRIALSGSTVAVLRHHRSQQATERLRLGAAWEGQDLVFANTIGKPLDRGAVLSRWFRPLLATAGLPRIRFHDLRHTAATLLLTQGVHVKVVSEMLGHSSIGLTLDTYSHVLPDLQQQAATAMEHLLGH